ncbi:MAG: sugar O-acetyltransferase [Clostridiales bacterium]|nr:sugar O-acetyltransferase [Clostridiales bacterium]
MNQKERMLAGLPYRADFDGLPEERDACKRKTFTYNQTPPWEHEALSTQLRELLGKVGEGSCIEPPFHCDYGWNIELGSGCFINYNLTILDVGKVTIGDGCLFAPNVSIYTAGHPIHPDSRLSYYEYGIPITIGSRVWLGGNVVVLPGVTIGDDAVIGAGSVVTKDIPAGWIAAGNPCKLIRQITEADRDYYFKDRKFDVADY